MDLSSLNLEQLGTAGLLVALLLYQNHGLKTDLKDEREYSRELQRLYQESTLKTIATMQKLEAAFTMLKDGLR